MQGFMSDEGTMNYTWKHIGTVQLTKQKCHVAATEWIAVLWANSFQGQPHVVWIVIVELLCDKDVSDCLEDCPIQEAAQCKGPLATVAICFLSRSCESKKPSKLHITPKRELVPHPGIKSSTATTI